MTPTMRGVPILLVLLALLLPVPAAAAGAPPAAEGALAPEVAAEALHQQVPRPDPPPRTLRAYWHLFLAFAFAWLLLFGYLLRMGMRFGRLEEELETLRDALGGEHGRPPPA